jgi:DNA methylase
VPNKKNRGRVQAPPKRPKPFYKQKPLPPPEHGIYAASTSKSSATLKRPEFRAPEDFVHAEIIPASHFELREDGSIQLATETQSRREKTKTELTGLTELQTPAENNSEKSVNPVSKPPRLIFQSDHSFLRLYHGNCLELLDAISAKYPEGRFDAIFADPPYFLSNGGISCHAGKMVKVDKGGWDKSRGAELNHEFNREWLKRCQRVLKPNGTIWITGTHHVIFSIGYAMQQLG